MADQGALRPSAAADINEVLADLCLERQRLAAGSTVGRQPFENHGVQDGWKPADAKALKARAEGAVQLSEDHDGETYRAVYTVELEDTVYVLRCFHKKSKKGVETPKKEIDVIEQRLKMARLLHAQRKGSKKMTSDIEYEISSGNLFEDLGFDRVTADRLAYKAGLVGVLRRIQQERAMNQMAFSRLTGIPQPRLSKQIAEVSTDRLLDAIARLGGHVAIRVEAHPAKKKKADIGRAELELA